MLSYKVTYAIQILELIRHSKEGMSLNDLRYRFRYLPNGLVISDIAKQLMFSRIIGSSSSKSSRFQIKADLNELTVSDLILTLDDKLVFGAPVGFNYWQDGFLETHTHISELEQSLESHISWILKSVSIAELLEESVKCNQMAESKRERTYIKHELNNSIKIKNI